MKKQADRYLTEVLYSYHRNRLPKSQLKHFHTVRHQVIRFFQQQYSGKTIRVGDPFLSGSYAKKTDINAAFDIDIVVPFRSESGFTTETIQQDALDRLEKHFKSLGAEVSMGTNSVQMKFLSGTTTLELDVVLGVEMEPGGFKPRSKNEEDKFLVLFNRGQKANVTTNLHRQKRVIKEKGNQQRIPVKLLKIWKYRQRFLLSSYIVEMMSWEAFQQVPFSGKQSPSRLLAHVLDYNHSLLERDEALQDVGANYKLQDFLKTGGKQSLAGIFKKMLAAIEQDDLGLLRDYFPVNGKYVKGKDGYTTKN